MEIEVVIGLEIHAQLSTKTKMFCRCKNEVFNAQVNSNVCPVCMGFPGQLPVLNKKAFKLALKAALALNCSISEKSKMDRKNYFYPDNPRGFQISQFDEPLSQNGFLDIEFVENNIKSMKRIGITRIHIEDDAGKLTHFDNFSLIDFNRAGVPLIEIVSMPDISSAIEASIYAKEIQKILRYAEISDADMEKGQLRFDASVSVRKKGDKHLNPRAEIKNLNSFKSLEIAINYEFERQKSLFLQDKLLDKDITLGFDDKKLETYFMREKEESLDYKYFPEPDIPVLNINKLEIEAVKSSLPMMPSFKKNEYINMGIREEEALFISSNPRFSSYFDELVNLSGDLKLSITFFNSVLVQYLKDMMIEIDDQKVSAKLLSGLIKLVKNNTISLTQAKNEIFPDMFESGLEASFIIEKKGLSQISDVTFIEQICQKIISENPDSVSSIKNGKDKVLGFLIGLVMKESKGKANPSLVDQVIRRLINF